MSYEALADIDIQIETPEYETGNLQSILNEIKYSLEQLIKSKKTHSIDLRAMPWSPGEEEKLEQYLGKGEINVELNVLGKSFLYETSFSGIWVVSHYNEENEIIGKLIEITTMPEILFSAQEELKSSLERMQQS